MFDRKSNNLGPCPGTLFLFVSAQVRCAQLFFLKMAHYRVNSPIFGTNSGAFIRSSVS